jgi:hypothetical protein
MYARSHFEHTHLFEHLRKTESAKIDKIITLCYRRTLSLTTRKILVDFDLAWSRNSYARYP